MKLLALLLAWLGCASPTESSTVQPSVATDVRHQRLALIRDAAAEMGVHNAALMGGIAISETQLAHCWKEATYACMGPASSSCGGDPIIAGSADGPCSDMQGGLGMFQFDAGTYAQTLATYGDSILTVEGNTAQAVAFVVDKVERDIPGIDDWLTAVAWMDTIPLVAGDPVTEQWAKLLACRYNGCCSTSSLCTSRANGYRDHAIELYGEMGGEFWRTSDRCGALPSAGIIDQRTACYVAGGDPRAWHREAGGFDDTREYLSSTAAKSTANFAQWLLRPGRPTAYHIEAHISGGAAVAAVYQIVHAGVTERVTIDQSGADGFIALGDFELAADATEYVLLADNTGTAGQKIVFDALRVTAVDGGGSETGSSSGCSAGGGAGLGAVFAFAFLRRRRYANRAFTSP